MATPQVYGFCDAKCKHPVYTQQQVLTILQQMIDGGSLAGIDPDVSPVVALIQEQRDKSNVSLWIGTEAQYNALDPVPAASLVMGRLDSNGVLYFCTDDSTITDWQNYVIEKVNEEVTQKMQETLQTIRDELAAAKKYVDETVVGKQQQHTTATIKLTAAAWSSKAQTVTAAGVTANNTVIIAPAPTSQDDYTAAGIKCTAQAANALTFTCEKVPTAEMTVNVVIMGV